MTDGIVDTGDRNQDLEKEKWLKEDLALESKKAGIRIIGVAFTDDADFLLIQTLAIKTGGEYFRAYKAEDIQDVFKKINEVISRPPEKPDMPVRQVKPETPVSPPPPAAIQKGGVPLPLVIAGIIVIMGVIILFVILKRKPKVPLQSGPGRDPIDPSGQEGLPMPQAKLIDVDSVISKENLILVKSDTRVGRESHNDIVIPKDTISSDHATIKYKDGNFYLEDQRSSNGTSLNNKKIEPNKSILLKNGDSIKFDAYEFRLTLPEQTPAGATVLGGRAGGPQGTGTTIRPPEAKADSLPAKESPPQEAEPENDGETRLKPGMCPEHPARKAVELCMMCKNAYCKQCITEKDGKNVCLGCAEKLS